MKFIHVTDSHLVPRGQRLHGLDPVANLEDCVASIAREHGDAAFCVITGDLADAGEPGAYAALREILPALPMPVHLIPGNHDAREALVTAFPTLPRDEHGFVQGVFRHEGATFLLLDTLEPAAGSGGAYCERRTRWLAARLAEAGTGPAYVLMHHPPFAIGLPGLDAIALLDPEPFARTVAAAGNVRHIFFGHAHRPVSGQWRGIGFSTGYGTSHQTRLDFHGRGRLAYTAEPPGYAVVLLDEERVVVHTCLFQQDVRDIRDPDRGAGQTG